MSSTLPANLDSFWNRSPASYTGIDIIDSLHFTTDEINFTAPIATIPQQAIITNHYKSPFSFSIYIIPKI
jgi:hypothetical protein